jgi:hypothetical protein
MFEVYMLQPVNAACELFGSSRRRNCVAEPNLDELMRDPMTLALMAADGVDRHELQTLFTQVRSQLR